MVRKTLLLTTLVAGLASGAPAANRNTIHVTRTTSSPAYRIELRGKSSVLSKDQPVRRGTVVLFHRYPDGILTSVPIEDVAVVASAAAVSARPTVVRGTSPAPVTVSGAVALQPGDTILLGPTGGGSVTGATAATGTAAPAGPPSPSGDIPARLAAEAQVFPGDLPVPASGGQGSGAMVNGTPVYGGNGTTVINPTLQTNPATGSTALTGATGNPNATTSVAPNGFPATTNGAQSGVQPIDPNGFPSLTTPSTGTTGTTGTTTTTTGTRSSQSAQTSSVTTAPGTTTMITNAPAGTRGSTAAAAAAAAAAQSSTRASTARGPGAVGVTNTAPANSSAVGAARTTQSTAPSANAPANKANNQNGTSTNGTVTKTAAPANGTTASPQGGASPQSGASPQGATPSSSSPHGS